MPTIKFSVCPSCDCNGFDFYETTGRTPGVSTGYDATADLTTYTGTLTWRTPDGTTVGTYSVTPTENASDYVNIEYATDATNQINDGAYDLTYEVRDASDNLIGSTVQPVVISCALQCEVEKKIDSYSTANGHGKDVLREEVNTILNMIRMANWLAQAGYTEKADSEITMAEDYV